MKLIHEIEIAVLILSFISTRRTDRPDAQGVCLCTKMSSLSSQPAALRMRELGADSAAPPTAEYIPQPLRARDDVSATHLLLQH
jgi:hypothetical protein